MSDRTTAADRSPRPARPGDDRPVPAPSASTEEKLGRLRELVLSARAMPMSASCVINRGEVLAAIDDVIDELPAEISDAQRVIDRSTAKIAEGEAESKRLVSKAKHEADRLARESEIVRVAEERAAAITAEAEAEAAALRKETDLFIDSRMASFESVLHKTSSQVRTARIRLADRSNLDPAHGATGPSPAE